MKVTKNDRLSTIEITEIKDGTCFSSVMGELFLKVSSGNDRGDVTAVKLSTGELGFFPTETVVNKVKAEVFWSNETE